MISYMLKNGDITEINVLDYANELVITEGNSWFGKYSFTFNKDNALDLNHIYPDKSDLLKFESIRIEENDGTQRTTDAPMARLRLSEEQQKAVANFLAARKSLKEAGVGLIWNSADCDFYAMNINDFNKIKSDEPSGEFEECLKEGVLRIDKLPGFMQIDFE